MKHKINIGYNIFEIVTSQMILSIELIRFIFEQFKGRNLLWDQLESYSEKESKIPSQSQFQDWIVRAAVA